MENGKTFTPLNDMEVLINTIQGYERRLADLSNQLDIMVKQMGKARELAAYVIDDTALGYTEGYLLQFPVDKVNDLLKFVNKYDYCARLDKLRGEKDDHSTTTE